VDLHKVQGQKRSSIRDPVTNEFSTVSSHQHEAWLIKFPAQQEHPEVCAIEAVYAECYVIVILTPLILNILLFRMD
jgi:hypothetical protein